MNWIRRHELLAIPLFWLIAAIALIDPASIELRSDVPPQFSELFYEPTDMGAFVVRGANQSMGRLPGGLKEPPWTQPGELAHRLEGPPLEYTDRYYLEYPSPALFVFGLGYWSPCEMPPAVADAHYFAVAHFKPRSKAERNLWKRFHAAAIVHLAVMAAALIALLLVLQRGYEPGSIGPVWLAVLPAAVFFSINRFDILPALATALGFACLARNRPAWSGVWFGCGVLLKLYPVLFIPMVLRFLGPKRGLRWLAGFVGICALILGEQAATLGWEPLVRPVQVQLARSAANDSSTLFGRLLPEKLGTPEFSKARLAILAASILLLAIRRPPDFTSVLRRCLIVLTVFVALATFWSPQWIVWFLPIVVPLAARHRWLIAVAAILDIAIYCQFPLLSEILWHEIPPVPRSAVMEVLVDIHVAVWAAFVLGMVWHEWRSRRSGPGEACP